MAPPEPDERAVNDGELPPSSEPSVPDVDRPDWLVGPDEGARSEQQRLESDAPVAPLRLVRPGQGAFESGGAPEDRTGRPLRDAKPPAPAEPARKVAWTAAASSIPRLRAESPASPIARVPAPAKASDSGEDDASEIPADDHFPDDVPASPSASRSGPALAPLHESWWVIALEELRSNRRTQILVVGALVAALAAWIFWPQGERGVDLASIRRHPDRFESRTVRVKGRVGEVFHVGGGYAFYLLQGRDTIVVFTRSRVPVPRQNVTVVASVSTGFLDGAPRPALFEEVR